MSYIWIALCFALLLMFFSFALLIFVIDGATTKIINAINEKNVGKDDKIISDESTHGMKKRLEHLVERAVEEGLDAREAEARHVDLASFISWRDGDSLKSVLEADRLIAIALAKRN